VRYKLFSLIIIILLILGCGKESTSVSMLAPENLEIELIGCSEIFLSWDDVSSNESGFILQRKLQNEEFETIAELEADIEEYTDLDLETWNTYYYRVAAVFDDELSSWSNAVNIYTQPQLADLDFGTETSLDVLTWNIEHFPKMNGTTINLAAQSILAMSPEVAGLQEIENSSAFNELLNILNNEDDDNVWEGFRSEQAYYDINLAIVYKANLFSNISISEIYTSDWSAFPRPPVVFDAVYNGERVVVINNHFKASGGASNEARRREACEKLKLYIDENLDNENVIVIGDMNDELDDPVSSNVFQGFIDDEENYCWSDWEIAFGDNDNWSYPGWPSHLDHILITNELFDNYQVEEVFTVKPELYIEGGWSGYDSNLSDHRPVGIRIRF